MPGRGRTRGCCRGCGSGRAAISGGGGWASPRAAALRASASPRAVSIGTQRGSGQLYDAYRMPVSAFRPRPVLRVQVVPWANGQEYEQPMPAELHNNVPPTSLSPPTSPQGHSPRESVTAPRNSPEPMFRLRQASLSASPVAGAPAGGWSARPGLA